MVSRGGLTLACISLKKLELKAEKSRVRESKRSCIDWFRVCSKLALADEVSVRD